MAAVVGATVPEGAAVPDGRALGVAVAPAEGAEVLAAPDVVFVDPPALVGAGVPLEPGLEPDAPDVELLLTGRGVEPALKGAVLLPVLGC